MKTIFDSRGNFYPPEKAKLDFGQFKEWFVDDFDAASSRKAIFEEYKRFLLDFRQTVTNDFVQWINGSFVSNKANPGDIDFVTLIDHQTFRRHEAIIEKQFTLWGAMRNYKNLDAYTIKLFPEGHREHVLTKSDLLYWKDWFGHTQLNRAKRSFPKGYVEIQFDENTII